MCVVYAIGSTSSTPKPSIGYAIGSSVSTSKLSFKVLSMVWAPKFWFIIRNTGSCLDKLITTRSIDPMMMNINVINIPKLLIRFWLRFVILVFSDSTHQNLNLLLTSLGWDGFLVFQHKIQTKKNVHLIKYSLIEMFGCVSQIW